MHFKKHNINISLCCVFFILCYNFTGLFFAIPIIILIHAGGINMFEKEDVPSTQGLKIIIIGCGKVGRTLVEQLSQEGHDITIIDKNRERISQLANLYDV